MRWSERLVAKAEEKARERREKTLEAIAHRLHEAASWISLERIGSRLVMRAKKLRKSLAEQPQLRAILGGWA